MFRTRFAPSPTGYLHVGHAFSARKAYDMAQEVEGEMLLRIENIDTTRCRDEYEAAIYEDLAWLGTSWPEPVRRQAEHFPDYEKALEKLIDLSVVYRCFRTRKEVAEEIMRAPHLGAEGPEGPIFTGDALPPEQEANAIKAGKPFCWRLSMHAAKNHLGASKWEKLTFMETGEGPNGETGKLQATPEVFGDVIIARKDVGTSYHLASVHDDALQGITHVIRGQDLFFASHLHRLLQELLGLPQPIYHHHRLITDENGKKYSKRNETVTLRSLRQSGFSADKLDAFIL